MVPSEKNECPECGRRIGEGIMHCPHCGAELGKQETPAEVAELFESDADLQIGRSRLVFDASAAENRAVVSLPVHNYSDQPCDIEVPAAPGRPEQRLRVDPGADAEIALGRVTLEPVWRGRNDLLLCRRRRIKRP